MTPREAAPVPDPSVCLAARESSCAAAVPSLDRDESSLPPPSPESEAALVAFAFAEYQRLCMEGETPDIQDFCAQFPFPSSCRSELRAALEAELRLGSLIDRLTPGSSDDSRDWPSEGEQREGFRIQRQLARGSFARIYLACEPSTGDRLVVLKCSRFGDAEARTMGRLSHPGIVPIHSAQHEVHSGLSFVCMPYLGSTTLQDVLDSLRKQKEPLPGRGTFLLDVIRSRVQPEDPPLPAPDARLERSSYVDAVIHLAVQLAETLAFVHERGVLHRDLKPSNVLLDSSAKPLLLDFNLSQSACEPSLSVGGTLPYMAPEHLRAYLERRKEGLDERADLYALGVMIYELLTSEHPYARLEGHLDEQERAQTLLAQANAGFRSFRKSCPELERPVAAILDRCLALDRADRPRHAAELAAELKRQFTPARQLRRWFAARQRSVLTAVALCSVVLSVFSYSWAVMPPYGQREYDQGRLAYRAGDYDAAATHFEHAVNDAPHNARFRFARGCARLQQSKQLPPDRVRFDQIWDDLASTGEGATDAQAVAVTAYIQLRKQHYDDAIRLYGNSVLSGYRPVMVLNNRAYAYISRQEWEKAQHDLDRAVELEPHCQAARYNRALLAIQLRLQRLIKTIPPVALEDMEEAFRAGPITSTLYRDAAILYAHAAQEDATQAWSERARACLRQALMAGVPASQFQAFPVLRMALKQPEFAALLRNPPPQTSVPADLRLLEPVELPD